MRRPGLREQGVTAGEQEDVPVATVESVGTIFNPTVRYAYIAVSDNPGLGVWATGLTSQGVADFLAQYGTRLTCLDRYVDAFGQTRWAAAAVDAAAVGAAGEGSRDRQAGQGTERSEEFDGAE